MNSRRAESKSFRRAVLPTAVATALAAGSALADPPVNIDPPVPQVFCFRITDMERPADAYLNDNPLTGVLKPGNAERFLVEFEVLNWTNDSADGLYLALAEGTSAGVTLAGAGIDRDGRGGTIGDGPGPAGDPKYGEIDYQRDGAAQGTSDATPHQSGRGNIQEENDWDVTQRTTTAVLFDTGIAFVDDGFGELVPDPGPGDGTPLSNQDLIAQALSQGYGGQIPGLGNDATGDTAIDGGPGQGGFGTDFDQTQPGNDPDNPVNGLFVSGESPDVGTGNVLDGFVLEIDGLGVGDTVAFNWFLLDAVGGYGGFGEDAGFGPNSNGPTCADAGSREQCFDQIGRRFFGTPNQFGFGTFTLGNIGVGGDLPGPLFEGNSGLNQSPVTFFGGVQDLPNAAEFGAEFGAAQTAPCQNPDDCVIGGNTILPNTQVAVSEPTVLGLTGLGALAFLGMRRRRRHTAG